MFYDVYAELCKQINLSDSKVAEAIGLNRSAVVKWKKGATPAGPTIQKLADYFGVTADYLLGGAEQKEIAPILTKKDERDIARDLEKFIEDMDNSGDLMFDGDPMSLEARESVIAAMKLGLQAAKLKNKERFTPKKYRDGNTKKE